MKGGASGGELSTGASDGTAFPLHTRSATARTPDGATTVGISVDVAERIAMEHQLRAITDSIGDGLCNLDGEGLITYVNQPGCRLLRTSLPDALGGQFMHWVHSVQAPLSRTDPWSSNPVPTVECQLVRQDGTELPIEYVATPFRADVDTPAGWVVVFRDISDRRARDAGLAQQVEAVAWLGRIKDALEHDGFVLHAQPIVDLETGQTVQHELLLRMRDRDDPDAMLPPALFLPTAEEFGVAPAIDRWVLARGLALAAEGHPVEINLSATSLDDAALPHLINQLLDDTGADPADIVFEVTETALMENPDTARQFAIRMRELGCRLALDDFGTGYGGFTYLKHLPVDFLKIDIEFVRDAVINRSSRHVIEAVVGMAKAFGLQTVAEGVEEGATLALLKELHVDYAQGYLLGRPTSSASVFASPAQREQR